MSNIVTTFVNALRLSPNPCHDEQAQMSRLPDHSDPVCNEENLSLWQNSQTFNHNIQTSVNSFFE